MKVNYRARNRAHLVEQLGGKCAQCGSVLGLQIDHVVPMLCQNKKVREYDLRHPNIGNLQLLCYFCHIHKSNRDGSHSN
jgi:5-methylcytosine-specific restriction endonuclease McrA